MQISFVNTYHCFKIQHLNMIFAKKKKYLFVPNMILFPVYTQYTLYYIIVLQSYYTM